MNMNTLTYIHAAAQTERAPRGQQQQQPPNALTCSGIPAPVTAIPAASGADDGIAESSDFAGGDGGDVDDVDDDGAGGGLMSPEEIAASFTRLSSRSLSTHATRNTDATCPQHIKINHTAEISIISSFTPSTIGIAKTESIRYFGQPIQCTRD